MNKTIRHGTEIIKKGKQFITAEAAFPLNLLLTTSEISPATWISIELPDWKSRRWWHRDALKAHRTPPAPLQYQVHTMLHSYNYFTPD